MAGHGARPLPPVSATLLDLHQVGSGKAPGTFAPSMNTNDMKTNKLLDTATWSIVVTSAVGTLSVSLMALVDPRGVMALVHTPLTNTDAFSSIRGVFGGVGFMLAAAMVWIFRRDRTAGVGFLALFWGNYALCRALTIVMDGPLGDFGNQWIGIETTLAVLSTVVYVLRRKALSPVRTFAMS